MFQLRYAGFTLPCVLVIFLSLMGAAEIVIEDGVNAGDEADPADSTSSDSTSEDKKSIC